MRKVDLSPLRRGPLLQEWFRDTCEEVRQRAASSRDGFFRELYTRVANQKPTPEVLGKIRDAVILHRMR